MKFKIGNSASLQTTGSIIGFNTTQHFKRYNFLPKEDITAYELALCWPVLLNGFYEALIEALPEEARRHFVEIN